MLRNLTSKELLAHLHYVMILLLSLGLIISLQGMRGEEVCRHSGPLSTGTPPPHSLTFFSFGLNTLYRPGSLIASVSNL